MATAQTLCPKIAWHLSHPEHGTKPWEVQAEALRRSAGRRGFGYWLEQGLGKTPLGLNDFYDHWLRNECDACVVIAPQSFKKDWADAVEEWGLGSKIRSEFWPECELPDRLEAQLLAINYEAVTRPGKTRDYMLWLMDQSRVFLLIDETSSCANPTSDQTKGVIEMAKRAAFIRGLNGTPYTGSVMNYWGQLRSIGQISGTNPYAFRNKYAEMGGYMGKKVTGIRNEEELARLLDGCTFRALKKDWRKDLPPQIDTEISVQMTPRQQRHYREMMEEFYTQVEETEVSAEMVLVQMGKLRQISSCLVLKEGYVEWIEKPKDIPKRQAAIDWYDSGSTKAIITCVYSASLDMLVETFKKLCPAVIRGNMTPQEWTDSKRLFNEDPRCRLLIGQQSATFRGHTLIGGAGQDRCTRMFFYESDFSYYQRAQLRDRIHRGAQDQDCLYTDVLTSRIDRRTLDIVRGKKNTADWVDGLVAAVRQREW